MLQDALAVGGVAAALLALSPEEAEAAYANRRGGGGGTVGTSGYDTFYGLARPPASYGFSARTDPKSARYSYEYPSVRTFCRKFLFRFAMCLLE